MIDEECEGFTDDIESENSEGESSETDSETEVFQSVEESSEQLANGETQNDQDGDDGADIPAIRRILQAIVIFLSLFQLKFHIPERGMTMLLKFIQGVIKAIVSIASPAPSLLWLKENFPSSRFLLRKQSGVGLSGLKKYVVCSKCHSMYNLVDCIDGTEPNKCCYVAFPNHPHISKRAPCNSVLLKKVKYGSTYKYIPKKLYLYNNIIDNLQSLLQRPGTLRLLSQWKEKPINSEMLTDITDGQV